MATLNLHNPEGLYTGGNVNFNPLPYVQLAMQARQRKQAREDAIDKYYTEFPNKINDKGVRDQEIPVLNKIKTDMSEFYIKNKAAIDNPKLDNGAAKFNLEKLFRTAEGIAAESKNRGKTDAQLGKWRFNKEKEYIFKKPKFLQMQDAHNKAIGEEGSQGIDIASLDIPTKPLDLKEFRKELVPFKYSEGTPVITDHPTDKLSQVVTSNPVLDDATKKQLYDFAATKLHMDDSFSETIKENLANTGLLPNLVEIAKTQFGVKDASNMTDEDLAAAFAYSQLQSSQTKAKVKPDTEAIMDKKRKENMEDQKILIGLRGAEARKNQANNDRLIRGRIKDKVDMETVGNLADNIFTEVGQVVTLPNGEKRTAIFKEDVDPARWDILRGFNLSKKQLGINPDVIEVPNGTGFGTVEKEVLYQDPSTRDVKGKDGKTSSRERINEDYINTFAPSAQRVKTSSKASENTTPKGSTGNKTTTKQPASNKKVIPNF